jgi:ribosomal-protein-alanine N-acetyltransferase
VNVIETERLLLEPLTESRLEDFVELMGLEETMRYWGTGGPYTPDVAERHFNESVARVRRFDFGKRWIVAKQTSDGLGFTETNYVGEGCGDVSPIEIEIGWMLTPSAWGHGYATEAARAIRDEAFERLELESIIAMHHPENAASRRIMEKLGMEFERDIVGWLGEPLRVHRLTRERWATTR